MVQAWPPSRELSWELGPARICDFQGESLWTNCSVGPRAFYSANRCNVPLVAMLSISCKIGIFGAFLPITSHLCVDDRIRETLVKANITKVNRKGRFVKYLIRHILRKVY